MIKSVLFDAYGTLYDVHSVTKKCNELYHGRGMEISQIWRQKQLDYVWITSLMDKYKDFWSLTKEALYYSLEELGLQYNEKIVEEILNEYLHLSLYPEVMEALNNFRPRELFILSNGNLRMLNELVKNTYLDKHLDGIISVEDYKVYKPKPDAYDLAAKRLGLDKEEILFISSNGWDAAGSKSFGFTVGWLNRFGKPADRLGMTPDFIASDLKELAQITKSI
ncbi:haloacid dehalogenase type II [Lacrimispora sp. 38-1]|uniref:haloacid dehalogenase type II n=1 Tax=Lacrimispora sp. 38-1 TaxID=3125778 RepID=UPI003CEB2DDD